MTRRVALVAPVLLLADERSRILDLVTPLATALSNGNADAFMRRISDDAPDRLALSDNIRGLTAQAEVTSSIQIVRIEDGGADLDWLMDIRSKARQSLIERRRGRVQVRAPGDLIAALQPVEFFRPAAVR